MQQEKPRVSLWKWIGLLERLAWFKPNPSHKDYTAAAYALADAPALKRLDVRKKQSEVEYQGVHPDIVSFWKAFCVACKGRNIPVMAFEMLRTEQRQMELYAQGRTKAKAGESPHQYGLAVDVVPLVNGQPTWSISKKQWDIIGAIGKEVARKRNIKIEWGGDWGWDYAHWEIMGWRIHKDWRKGDEID